MIQGVIFDYDGTIGDTVFPCMEALRRTLLPILGRSLDDAELRGYFGPTEEGIFQKRFPERADELTATYLEHYRELHRDVPEPFPGIVETIRGLKAKGVRVALVTAKGRGSWEISLEFHPIADLFERIEVGSPLGRDKDRKIVKVMSELGLKPEETAYVGDGTKDVVSSRKAGVSAWAVAWASTARRAELAAAEPDRLFDSVAEFRAYLETLFGKF